MAVQVKFADYDFEDRVERWRSRRTPVIDAASVPKRDGLIITGGKLGPREIEVQGTLMGSSTTDLRNQRDNLLAGILKKTANLTLFDDRYVEARVVQYTDNYIEGSALCATQFSIVFLATLPYMRSTTLSSSEVSTTTSTNTDFNITTTGNYETFTKITITAPVASDVTNSFQLFNLTRDEDFQFLGTIVQNTSFIMDAFVVPPTFKNNGVSAVSDFRGDPIKLNAGLNNMRAINRCRC